MTKLIPSPSKVSTSDTSSGLHRVFDASTALPLTNNFTNEPTDLRYYRFFDFDDSEMEYEIFVPSGKEQEVLDLDANRQWARLREFPAFSDVPPPDQMRPDVRGVPQADGTTRYFHIPDEDTKQARADELMRAEDYETLADEFEPWSKYSRLSHLVL